MVDWAKLLSQSGIEHFQQRDEILVRCPWCGDEDPSQHLSINTRGRGWRCLRSPGHKGKSNVRLAAALFRCDEVRARELVGAEEAPLPSRDEFATIWRRQIGLEPPTERPTRLELSLDFYNLAAKSERHSPFARMFWNYLIRRGFTEDQIKYINERYNLHYAIHGSFTNRLIIPIYDRAGRLATWTGRTIAPRVQPRYKTLYKEQSVRTPSELLLGMSWLLTVNNPRMLVVCEGPLDAIKVTALGHDHGIYGTCLFGKQITANQSELLFDAGQVFRQTVLMLDKDAWFNALEIACEIPYSSVAQLPEGIKDPGDLSRANGGLAFLQSLEGKNERPIPRRYGA